jgi:hypothetical protein
MPYVPYGQSVQIVDRTGPRLSAHHSRGGANLATARHRSQILVPPSVLYSQIPFPTEYPDGFTTFTPSIATTPLPTHLRNRRIIPRSSRPRFEPTKASVGFDARRVSSVTPIAALG